jgi:ATP-binding cassette subfamily F protein uup
LPGEINTLQAKIGALHERLSDPNLYARERAAFEQASAELATAEKDLAAAEERWLELEILREDVAGQ